MRKDSIRKNVDNDYLRANSILKHLSNEEQLRVSSIIKKQSSSILGKKDTLKMISSELLLDQDDLDNELGDLRLTELDASLS